MNHPFYFCINCQLRIPTGQEIEKSEGQWLCKGCEGHASTVAVARPALAMAAAVPAPTTFAPSPPKLKASSAKVKARADRARPEVPEKTEGTPPWIYAVSGFGAVVVLALLFVMFRGKTPPPTVASNASKPASTQKAQESDGTTKSQPVSNQTLVATATPPVANVPITTLQAGTDKDSDKGRVIPPPIAVNAEADDPRAAFAQREWVRIQEQEKAGTLSGADLYHRIKEFVDKNNRTAAGKSAAERLKDLPVPATKATPAPVADPGPLPSTPEPTTTKIFFSSNFDDDKDKVKIVKGSRGNNIVYGSSGASLHALNMGLDADSKAYFKSVIDFRIDPGVVVTEHTWIRFACRSEGTKRICVQTFTNMSSFLEKYIDEGRAGEWHWVTFKLSDYTKNIWGPTWNKTGWTFSGTVIFSPGSMFMIDNLEIGEGPLPPTP